MNYANLPDRAKGFLIDQFLLIVVMYATSEILNQFENVPEYLRMSLFIFYFLLYEPICVHLLQGTVGHQFSNIRVVSAKQPSKSISIFHAVLRTWLKYLLGWISLITISGTDKRQGIHDSAGGSIVLRN